MRLAHLSAILVIACSGIAIGQSVTVSGGIAQESIDGSVVVPINLVSVGGAQAAAVQWSVNYPSDVTGVTFAVGTAATNAGKSLDCNGNTCLIYGINLTAISDGVLATITLQISSHPSFLIAPILITGAVAATAAGESIPAAGVSGLALLLPEADNPTSSNVGAQPVPRADSVSPSGSGGLHQAFTFVFSDSQSATNLAAAAILIAPTTTAENSCFFVYDGNRGTIQLESDNVLSSDSKPIGSSTTLQNSQCSIDATSVTATSLSTTISVEVTFSSQFTGLKNIYMYGADGDGSSNTGWARRGTYMVAVDPPPVPTADSVSPNSGSGFSHIFTFVFSDSQGAANLAATAMLFASHLDVHNSCYIVYDRVQATIQLEWDNVMGSDVRPVSWQIPLQNSQCAVGATSVTATELTTSITLDITFTSAFMGLKYIYLYGADGDGSTSTGWVQKGVWTPNPQE